MRGVIPGRAEGREPGIQLRRKSLRYWHSGPAASRRPGMTAETLEPEFSSDPRNASPMTSKPKMKFAVFLMADSNYHIAGWRHPDAYVDAGSNIQRWIEFAQTLERGKLDMLFVADVIGVPGTKDMESLSHQPTIDKFEPFTLLAALSGVTKNIGLVATSATAYNEPYSIARVLGSLDHLTGGRAGWNLVTGGCLRGRRELQRRRARRPRRPLRARRGIRRRGPRPVGQLRPRRIPARQDDRPLSRSVEAPHPQSQGQVFLREGPAQRVAPAAGLSGDRAGRHVGARAQALGPRRRRGVHRAVGDRGREGVLRRREGPDAAARPAPRRPEGHAGRRHRCRPLHAGGRGEVRTAQRAHPH